MYPIRINKFLTLANYCSRRQADKLIESGKVEIDGQSAKLGDKISANQVVKVYGKIVSIDNVEKKYIAFYKPSGVICTTDKRAKDNIVTYINFPERVYPIGRLDVKSEGLIFLTNDGEVVNKILKSQNKIEKEYLVKVNKDIDKDFINSMQKGVMLDGRKTLPAKAKKLRSNTFQIILIEGRKRQIRRMCQELNYRVVFLKRDRIGKITLGDLKAGKYKVIREEEFKKSLGI